jgi:hypothetical protein
LYEAKNPQMIIVEKMREYDVDYKAKNIQNKLNVCGEKNVIYKSQSVAGKKQFPIYI